MNQQRIGNQKRTGRRWPHLLIFLLSFLAPLASQAVGVPLPDDAEAPPASFLIERIVVEGTRHASPDLLVEESLLKPGKSYTEEELRQAVYRVKRLPFVLETSFSLRKGSERGSFELVITVEEINQLFLGLDTSGFVIDHHLFGSGSGTVGARAFLGAHGVAYAAIQGNQAQVGYTHYNLFGRRIFASVDYGRSSSCCEGLTFDFGDRANIVSPADFDSDNERWSLLMGFPLSTNHSLRFGVSSSDDDVSSVMQTATDAASFTSASRRSTVFRTAEARWIYDTTDDPVVPSRGLVATAGLIASRGHSDEHDRFSGELTGGTPLLDDSSRFENEARNLGLVGTWTHYWPVTTRQTLALGGTVSLLRQKTESRDFIDSSALPEGPILREYDEVRTVEEVRVSLGHSLRLWDPRLVRRFGDLRLETQLVTGYDFQDSDLYESRDSFLGVGASAGIVLRNRWGIFRFSLSYELVEG